MFDFSRKRIVHRKFYSPGNQNSALFRIDRNWLVLWVSADSHHGWTGQEDSGYRNCSSRKIQEKRCPLSAAYSLWLPGGLLQKHQLTPRNCYQRAHNNWCFFVIWQDHSGSIQSPCYLKKYFSHSKQIKCVHVLNMHESFTFRVISLDLHPELNLSYKNEDRLYCCENIILTVSKVLTS